MSYFPPTNSVVAFQSDPTKLVGTVSVVGSLSNNPSSVSGVGIFNVNHTGNGSILAQLQNSSVTALQGTNPWFVQLTSGSVITAGGNSSVQVVGEMPPQSVSGVGIFETQLPTAAALSDTDANPTAPAVGAFGMGWGGTNWARLKQGRGDGDSATGMQNVLPMMFNGTNHDRFRGNTSNGLLVQTGNASVIATQGTNPWAVQLTSGSIVASGNSSVQVVGTMPPQSVSGVGTFNVNHTGDGSIITVSTGSIAATFPAASLISGHASINGAGSVLVLASVQGTLHAYITDFLVSNTGAATTLVQFTDRDGSVMGKTIAPAGGGAVGAGITSPMRTLVTGGPVYVGAVTATSTLHAWVGGYKGL